MKKLFTYTSFLSVLIFSFFIFKNPEICSKSAISGILLSGRVIIPSLFPFTFCVLFILKSGVFDLLKSLDKITLKLFGLDAQMFLIFLLSLIGGYPLGAKMIEESKISRQDASVMINYCVNAGPAFVILTVGNGIFSSSKIGFLLFFSHIIPSIFFCILFKNKISAYTEQENLQKIDPIDNFVISASQSASVVFSICYYVILFSVINGYINFYAVKCTFLKYISLFLEVTNGISYTRNIILISAILGFGGICVWCQVFSICKNTKINYLKFAVSRILHAISSAVLSFLMIKTFNISINTLSSGENFLFSVFYDSASVAICLISMGIVLLISISTKKYTGNITEDLI